MNCPSCDGKNRDDARFCKFCGADLFARCSACGTVLDDDAAFCDACGTRVTLSAAPAATPAAARKVVTVMFADLSGSTALEERMDAESVRSILERFYAAMRTDIERFDGTVVKFTGDGCMAAFGVPDVREDDAARAVDSALAMQEEIHQLADDLGLDVLLNIGINTGEVVVSETDDDVVGDAVNVAARLEGAATGGEILVGEETWRLTRATSRYEQVQPLTLKGKAEPVPAYRLLAVDERTADSAAAPFVGRQAELGRLLDVFNDAVEANACRLVTIIGSPGLGKTRLARELMSELSDTARIRETRCDPAGGSTFGPVADALRAGSAISETASGAEIIAALAARLPDDDPDRDRVAQRAAAIFGVGLPGTTEETFWALRKLVEAAAREQPVVFVLDDIQWAEPLLLDLIEHLAEWIRDAPVLLVGTARPELRDLRPSLTEGGRSAAVIALEGLDGAATAQLALNLLETDSLPAELLAKIPVSTEGNPLFVRELVRMLVDDDVLRRTPDGWEVTVEVDAIQVPPTIQSLLSARVDRLRNDERTVVELASVVGKEFYRGAVVDLAPDGVKDLVDGCLESLRRKELVEPLGTYWIDEPVYTFHHALIADAAYRRVLKERRADLHERVAAWIEVKTADVLGEHYEIVGYHLEQAHEYKRQLGRPDDDLGSRAAELLGRAAQRALESDDLPAAATLSGRALERLPHSDERRAGPLLMRCEALLSMGDVAQGAAAVSAYDAIANTPRRRAWATCFHGQLATLTSSERLQATESLVAAAAAELAELGDEAGAAKAYTVHASALAGLGRFAECEAVLDRAMTAARAADDRRRITATLGAAPQAALWGPNPVSRAGGRCLDIVRLLRITTGSPAVEATSLRCQAVLEALRGRADAARRMLRSAQRTLTELGLAHELLEAEQFAGIVELVDGDSSAAERHLRAAHEGFKTVGVDVLAAQSGARLARALLNLGEDDEAEAFVSFAEQHGGQDLKTALSWRSAKAELLALRGEFAEARALAEEAVAIAERTDALIDHGIACRSLAVVLRAAGDADGAEEAEARAVALFEQKGATALIGSTQPIAGALEPPQQPPTRDTQLTAPDDWALGLPLTLALASHQRFHAAFNAQDLETCGALLTDDSVLEDLRPGMRNTVRGREAIVENIRQIVAVGAVNIATSPIAIRGELLALTRFVLSGPPDAGYEVELLQLEEYASDGRMAMILVYSPDDIDAALTELDVRFQHGEGAPFARFLERTDEYLRTWRARDLDAHAELLTEDIVLVDHRQVSFGERRGRDEYMSYFDSRSPEGSRQAYGVTIHRISANSAVTETHVRSLSPDGLATDTTRIVLAHMRGDRFDRIEYFPLERVNDAIARFDELNSVAPGVTGENECVRLQRTIWDLYDRGDVDGIRALLEPDASTEDLREGLRARGTGIEAQIAQFEAIRSLDVKMSALTPVAVRGERIAVIRFSWENTFNVGSSETYDILTVCQLSPAGKMRNGWMYEPHELDAAVAHADELFAQGEGRDVGSLDTHAIRSAGRYVDAYAARDWEFISWFFVDDYVLEDRRAGLHNTAHGKQAGVDNIRAAAEYGGDRLAFEPIAVRGERIALCRYRWDAEDWNAEVLVVDTYDDEGRSTHSVVFGPDDLDPAYAELDARFAADEAALADQRLPDSATGVLADVKAAHNALGPRPDEDAVADGPRNRCADVVDAILRAAEAGDWSAFDGLMTDNSHWEDRRQGFSATLSSRDERVANFKEVAELGARGSNEPIATRGDTLALSRQTYTVPSHDGEAFEVVALALDQLGSDGRLAWSVLFDLDDLDRAFDELDVRFIAGEGAYGRGHVLAGLRVANAFAARDWDEYRKAHTDDFVFVDHRPASLGEMDLEHLIEATRGMTDLLADVRSRRIEVLSLNDRTEVGRNAISGVTPDGAVVDLSVVIVSESRGGLISRVEYFPPDQIEGAMTHYEYLTSAGPDEVLTSSVPRGPAAQSLDNMCTRVRPLNDEAFAQRRWDELERLYADDFSSEDRRLGLKDQHGRDKQIQMLKDIAELGCARIEGRPVATRGQKLALFHLDAFDREGQILTELFALNEMDDDGRYRASILFDPDDLDAAFAELDERYIAGEGADHDVVLRIALRTVAAMNDGDWRRFRAMLADDIAVVDHRLAGSGRFNSADPFVESNRVISTLFIDFAVRFATIYRVVGDAGAFLVHIRGKNAEGGEVEMEHIIVCALRDGLAVVFEYFPVDRLDDALARVDELGAET